MHPFKRLPYSATDGIIWADIRTILDGLGIDLTKKSDFLFIVHQFGSTFWTNLAYLTLCITITTVAAMALLMFNCVLHMFFMWNNSTDIMADSSLPDTAVLWLTPHVLCRYCVKSEVWDKWPELLKSVHFKNTVARSSVLPKFRSFSI